MLAESGSGTDSEGVVCRDGHANAPYLKFCGECGVTLMATGTPTPPSVGAGDTVSDSPGVETGSSTGPTAAPAPTHAKSRLPWLIGAGLLLAGIAVGLLFLTRKDNPSEEPRPKTLYTLKGTLSAPECGGGFEIENAAVGIRDQNDRLIGATTTGFDTDPTGIGCEVEFSTQVPKANFYQLKVGTHGAPSYSFQELQSQGFRVSLSLG